MRNQLELLLGLRSDTEDFRCKMRFRGIVGKSAALRAAFDALTTSSMLAGESLQAQKKRVLEDFFRRKAAELLARAGGNKAQAAKLGGMDPPSFFRLLRRYGG